jgi:hypothetical protein
MGLRHTGQGSPRACRRAAHGAQQTRCILQGVQGAGEQQSAIDFINKR